MNNWKLHEWAKRVMSNSNHVKLFEDHKVVDDVLISFFRKTIKLTKQENVVCVICTENSHARKLEGAGVRF